ncbi:MAG: glycosyltransferase [Christiangramia sp.]|uniref:glycosyltransferase n=1 Tax=Christiangramia sp. TaxID=1931228 RepID=UPI003242DCB2
MNILHLSTVKTWGGGEQHIENLCLELQKLGVRSKVLLTENARFEEKLSNAGIAYAVAPLRKNVDPRYIFKIIAICKNESIDLLHLHDPNAITLAIIASKLAKLPEFIFSKKTSYPIKNRKQTLYKYNSSKIAKILCVSEETKKISARRIKNQQKLVTIYHGSNVSRLQLNDMDLRKKLQLPSHIVIVGMIANHIKAKDLSTFIRIIEEIVNKQKKTNFHFVQIGEFTEHTGRFQQEIAERQLENHVSFLGYVPNASGLIPQFDISLLTSNSEGLPQFLYESFYYKVPVLSTNVGGIPEIITNNENGFLSDAGDFQDLARKLVVLAEDSELRRKFAENAHQKLIHNFTSEQMARQTLEEYKKIIDGKV